ncbi:prolyl oligopeptidase family serine peptidase [Cellulophaga sp. Hel_I_12]|uniref:S9 family peptidase n=1 Tax=Cellulophaga sp. Hel_I_12 TaxID=1249972 RepID=UPI000647638E|nr:prolyl oligopeptidase family serine peptidase [Cellulophaga sp. Hel_I_12]
MKQNFVCISIVFTVFFSTISTAQDKVLQLEDYSKWKRIVSSKISPNGEWFTYGLRPNGGDDTLFVKKTSAKTSDFTYRIPHASSPSFSSNSKWAAYLISPSIKATKELKKSSKKVFRTAELRNLITGDSIHFKRATSMTFSEDGKYFAISLEKSESDKSEHKGQDLIVVDLTTLASLNFGNVYEFAFNKNSSHLAYTIDAAEMVGNGLYVYDLNKNKLQNLDSDRKTYSSLIWDDANILKEDWGNKGTQIAVLKGKTIDTLAQRDNMLLTVSNVHQNPIKRTLNVNEKTNFPNNFVISEKGRLQFSNDGSFVLFGIKEQEEKMKMDKDTIANLDVFHWNDETINSVQRSRENDNRDFTYWASFQFNNNVFTRLTDDSMRNLLFSRNSEYWVGSDPKPYINDVNWGISPEDLYRVNLKTGKRDLIVKLIKRPLGYSPEGNYYAVQKDTAIHIINLADNTLTNISKSADVNFMNLEHPYPHEKPPYGVAGWTKDGTSIILNHKYDLWSLKLDGSVVKNITQGFGDQEETRFRYQNLNPNAPYIDTKEPLLLNAYGEWTKKAGFYELKIGEKPKSLLFDDYAFTTIMKAEKSDNVVFTKESFVEFPDYYVSNTSFKKPQKLTDANPQQKEYKWGSKVLIDYTNSKGEKLQGTLTLPANYEKGKKYPMVVYFYEKMSDRHHRYYMPTYDDRPHGSTYASNGYLFFQPDNVYEVGKPGTSSLDCITSATQKVIDLGYADPKRIGLQGHSWSGYQSSFILTQTDMFACVVTGAPPTDLESFYNNIYGNTGTNHNGIMEIGQVRMGRGVTPWTHREIYQRENPMFHAKNIKVPFMILHGTADGAVDWTQGLEFYNAARRLGKEVIFLSYPGEPHHLSREANQKDFQIRMKQYFDHYLMDKEIPKWMADGIPHLKKLYDKAK